MNTRAEKERQRQVQEKCQAILTQLLRDEDNKYCVDCDAKGPRWAAWNLGIFLCIRCAGIHRNLGVHISKVKSVNLDTWTPEQVASLQQMGNSRARAVYEANLPDSFRRPQTDSSLEAFIRAKYEQKKYIAKEWVPPPAPKPAFEIDVVNTKKKGSSSDKKSRSSSAKGTDQPTPNAIPAPKLKLPSSSSSTNSSTVKSSPPSNNKSTVKPLPVKSNAAVDLLGLDDVSGSNVSSPSGSVGFGNFLSSVDSGPASSLSTPVAETASTSSTTALQPETLTGTPTVAPRMTEEENFFSQMDDPSKKQQLTKESILSLYGQSTSSQPNMFGVPGGMYVNPQQVFAAQPPVGMGYPNVALATSHSQPIGFVPNGMMGNPSANIQLMPVSSQPVGGLGVTGATNLVGGNNPFLNNPAAGMAGFYTATAASATNMMGQNPAAFGQSDLFSTIPRSCAATGDLMAWEQNPFGAPLPSSSSDRPTNTFFCNPHEQIQLQQHMAAMTLGGPQQVGHPAAAGGIPWTNQPAGHTLSTNLWQ